MLIISKYYQLLGHVERSNCTIKECLKKGNGMKGRLGDFTAEHSICASNSKTQFYWFVTLQGPVLKRPCITFPIHGQGK